MARGDMSFTKLTTRVQPGGAVQDQAPFSVRAVAYLPIMLLVAVLSVGAVTGLAKDKTPRTRTVSGQVMDDADNGVVGATVELKDLETGKVLDIYSRDGGNYQFADLRFDHDYTVQANYKGLYSESRQISSLETRTPLVLNLRIAKADK
jgi:hypothetical protein